MTTEAVFFFQEKQLVKEMLKSEFDALVEGVIHSPEYRGAKLAAVYLQINDNLLIQGLLFFVVRFDMQGKIITESKVPFHQLMQSASRGPDLGAGAVRYVSQSQCEVPWHKQNLWDPPNEVYSILVKAVKENRLQIREEFEAWDVTDSLFAQEQDIPTLQSTDHQHFTEDGIPVLQVSKQESSAADPRVQVLQQELSAMKAAHTVRLETLQKERDELKEKQQQLVNKLKSQAQEQLESLKQRNNKELKHKEQLLHALKEQLQAEQQRYAELKQQQAAMVKQLQQERERVAERMQQSSDNEEQLEQLKLAFDQELAAKVEAETIDVNQRLVKREVELFYYEEQMNLLKDEVELLKEDKQALISGQGKDILESLETHEVSLVFFEQGVGYITLSYDQVGRFLSDKTEFIAAYCDVSVDEYRAWQQHQQQAVCLYLVDGKRCGQAVDTVDMLADFIQGVSDRCEQHVIE